MRRSMYGGLLLSIILLSGCASVASLAESLNARQVQSCVRWSGFVGGGLAGSHMQVQGLTATGGVPLATCLGRQE